MPHAKLFSLWQKMGTKFGTKRIYGKSYGATWRRILQDDPAQSVSYE